MTTPRMRTIKETVEELKRIDEKTAIREHYVRELVNSNKIPYVKAGRKILVNFDAFIEYLQQPQQIDDVKTTSIDLFKRRMAQ